MNDTKAKELLNQLTDYYGEPILPMSIFCKAITTWFRCIEQNNIVEDSKIVDGELIGRGSGQHGEDYYQHLRKIETDIRKSSLLARLLYGKEELRTEKCPIHKGHWSGLGECKHGCDLEGWLPNGVHMHFKIEEFEVIDIIDFYQSPKDPNNNAVSYIITVAKTNGEKFELQYDIHPYKMNREKFLEDCKKWNYL